MKCAFVVDFCLAAHIPGITPIFLNACGGQGLGAAPLAVCCRNRLLKTGACHELSLNISTSPVEILGLSYSACTAAAAAMFIVFLLIRRYQKLV